MTQKRDFKGIWIPAEIWLDTKMTMQEKFFFVEIDSLDGDEGCFASNEYFSNFFGISKTRVSIVITSLIEKGYIKRTLIYREGTKQILKRVLNICYRPPLTKVKDPSLRKVIDPIQQKLKDNNTISNTLTNNTNENYTQKENSNEELFVAVDYVESESTIISQSKTEEIILRLGEGQSEKIAPEERMIQNVLIRAIEFFKAYPDQIKIMTANARIRESHDQAFFLQELEKFIRYNADNLSVMKNIEKHIPRKFGSWLQNYNSFNRKSSNYGKTGRKNKHLISEQDARDVLADLIENGI